MLGLLVFILACYGMTNILVYGKIFEKVRDKISKLGSLAKYYVHCPMCMGVPVGALIFCLNPFLYLFTYELSLVSIFIFAMVGSGTSYVLCRLFDDEGLNIKCK